MLKIKSRVILIAILLSSCAVHDRKNDVEIIYLTKKKNIPVKIDNSANTNNSIIDIGSGLDYNDYSANTNRVLDNDDLDQEKYYIVKKGDTLYSIAKDHNLDLKTLAKANNIGSDYIIFEGQKLNLIFDINPVVNKSQNDLKKKVIVENNSYFIRPTNGKLISEFRNKKVTKIEADGVILASTSVDVKAIGDGQILYIGDSIKSYGNLVLVEHIYKNEKLISAYAWLESIKVNEGQIIKKGDIIGITGKSANGVSGLLFQIRKSSKAVDPANFIDF